MQQKQQLLRAQEAAKWELEERQLHEKHQLAKKQLKDVFFLQRHQMLIRHEKELEQVRRLNQQKEEELLRRQQIEKKALPRRQRQEMKVRSIMFKESLRISNQGSSSAESDRAKIKHFEEMEKKKYKGDLLKQEAKHKRQVDALRANAEMALKELEQLQNEKRKMITEHESTKLKERDTIYQQDLNDWRSKLRPRKQKLEEEFQKQRNEQESFYGQLVGNGTGQIFHDGSVSGANSMASGETNSSGSDSMPPPYMVY